jgi:hypothetical protein
MLQPLTDSEFSVRALSLRHRFDTNFKRNRGVRLVPNNVSKRVDAPLLTVIDASARQAAVLETGSPSWLSDLFNQAFEMVKISKLWKSLSVEAQSGIRAALFGCLLGATSALILGISRGDETSQIVQNVISAAVGSGIEAGFLRFLTFWLGRAVELLRGTDISVLVINGCVLCIIDFFIILHKEGVPRTWSQFCEFLMKFLDCTFVNCVFLGVTSVIVSTYFPYWALFALMIVSSALFGLAKERLIRCSPSDGLIVSIMKVLSGVPIVLLGWVEIPLLKTNDTPEGLTCEIMFNLMEDPVYLNGYFVSRAVAVAQIRVGGTDFYNNTCTEQDIRPVPELASLIAHYRSIRGIRADPGLV